MPGIIGRLREKWASARAERKKERRRATLKQVEARTDRDRYDPHKYEGRGGVRGG